MAKKQFELPVGAMDCSIKELKNALKCEEIIWIGLNFRGKNERNPLPIKLHHIHNWRVKEKPLRIQFFDGNAYFFTNYWHAYAYHLRDKQCKLK